MNTWCEFCRDHFDRDHFTKSGNHRVGDQYGPTGKQMANERTLAELLDLLKPLMDPDFCQAFPSAWEICPFGSDGRTASGERLDGEQLWERLRTVYDRAAASVSL